MKGTGLHWDWRVVDSGGGRLAAVIAMSERGDGEHSGDGIVPFDTVCDESVRTAESLLNDGASPIKSAKVAGWRPVLRGDGVFSIFLFMLSRTDNLLGSWVITGVPRAKASASAKETKGCCMFISDKQIATPAKNSKVACFT